MTTVFLLSAVFSFYFIIGEIVKWHTKAKLLIEATSTNYLRLRDFQEMNDESMLLIFYLTEPTSISVDKTKAPIAIILSLKTYFKSFR